MRNDPYSLDWPNWPETIAVDPYADEEEWPRSESDDRACRRFWRMYLLAFIAGVAVPFLVRCS